VLTAEECAAEVVAGLADERFLITTHPVTEKLVGRKHADLERWLDTTATFRATKLAP
jgi:hypothetical protein